MTATIDTRPTTQARERRPSRRRRVLIAAAVLAAAAAAAVALWPGDQSSMHTVVPLDADVQGTYRLDDGQHLTLWGSEQSTTYELGGQATALMADGADRYTSMTGDDSLSVERNATGAVQGVTLQQAGQPPVLALRDPLHTEEDVQFASAGAELAGTLLLPPGPGPHPAVVFVHGADPGTRLGIYRLLGSHLARRGVATLIYDKRGAGESSGSHAGATIDDLTADALAGVELLTGHHAVDPTRVGVLGFSQGGWVVALAAQRSADIAFVIGFSPSGFSPADQQAWLHGSMLAARGFDESAMVIADRVSRMQYSSLDLVDAGLMPPIPHVPGFWFHALDPHMDSTKVWAGVRQPVLLAWGALDCQLPGHDSMRALGTALERVGNPDVTLTVLPGADHSFMLVEPCGHETGLAHHGTMEFADGYLGLAADWITNLDDPERVNRPQVAEQPDGAVLAWHLGPPAPAPWYGTLAFHLAVLVLLLASFGTVAARWLVTRNGHLAGITALAGVAATLTGFAAFAEIAVLGAVHSGLLIGGPTVQGTSLLITAARVLVAVAGALAAVSGAAAVRAARSGSPRGRAVWIVAGTAIVLVAWAAYWRLLPLL